MLLLCFASWSAVSILTPTNARHTSTIVLARVLVGVAQGFLIPAVHTVLSQWIPPHERARAVSLTTSGAARTPAASAQPLASSM
jgi:ACS family sodium-dependent inorganic phosphate cotransporter